MSPLRTLAAIVGAPGARARAVADRLDRLGTEGFVVALDELARDAALGTTSADTDAMLACALWLLSEAAGRDAIDDELLPAARSAKLEVATALLDDGNEPAHKALARKGRLADHGGPNRIIRHGICWNPTAREVASSLESFKTTATEPWMIEAFERLQAQILNNASYPDAGYWSKVPLPREHIERQIEHLARRPDRDSIAIILGDRLTPRKHVVRIAARRPTTAAIVDEILSHPRWMSHLEVRNAIIENPFTPLRVALLLLPTCRARLDAIAKTRADVHPKMIAAARLLSRRRE